MLHNYYIRDNVITLRPLTADDIELIRVWRNQDHIRKSFVYQETISKEQQQKWFEKYSTLPNDLMFIIELNSSKTPVGCAALYNLNIEDAVAEFGRLLIGESIARGRGIGLNATKLLCNFGFEELNLMSIQLEVLESNLIAYNLYSKVGFIRNGNIIKNNLNLIQMILKRK
ncbi:GNAT family N-acetyltransferase [Paenibacillus thermoaerophilus]|uniref:GNAT family N-acetyltransferase n=1 Tax=Paenibacillus thermoaerophilus TaxID=1215385 RepID=A0ABW2UZ26_9BACL|nr:GNAT family N-acetyltransferase [Paenibacillus thermoaerophilus]TMV17495.1 GNAT family N-acetyltransferase [Paenibacillus thermoaerophilus]